MGAIKETHQYKPKCPQKLHEKLGVTPESLISDVESLKDWMNKQSHFPSTDHLNVDTWLEHQIIIAKNSLERAKLNIDRYFTARTLVPNLFERRDVLDEELSQSFDNLTIAYVPGLTSRLLKVSIVRIENPEAELFNFEAHIKRCLMAMEYFLKAGFDFAGFHVVLDLQNFRLNHLARFNVSLLKSMSVAMKAYPVSFAAINILNAPPIIEKAMALFKPFLSAKLFNRIKLLKSVEELQATVGDVPLPFDYSGPGISQKENSEMMKKELREIREYILNCDRVVTDETKRLNKNSSPEFDPLMNGSFRKLAID